MGNWLCFLLWFLDRSWSNLRNKELNLKKHSHLCVTDMGSIEELALD